MRTVFLKLTSFHALLALNGSVAPHRAQSKGLQSSLVWLSQQVPAVLVPALTPFSCTCLGTHFPIRMPLHSLIPCTPEPHHLTHPRLTTSIVVLLNSNSSKSRTAPSNRTIYCGFSVTQSCWTLCNPMDCSTSSSLSFTVSWSYSDS